MRAINYLKANICRQINNGMSMIQSGTDDKDFIVNRSDSQIKYQDRSNLGLASIDRSAILSSAQNFFKSKGRE